MPSVRGVARLSIGLSAAFFAGCGGMLKQQVENDVQLAAACQEVQASQAGRVPIGKEAFIKLVELRVLGELTVCEVSDGAFTEKSVLYCGISDELVVKNSAVVKEMAELRKTAKSTLATIKGQIDGAKVAMKVVRDAWDAEAEDCYQVAKCVERFNGLLSKSDKEIRSILKALSVISVEVDTLQGAVSEAEVKLNEAARQDQMEVIIDAKRVLINVKTFLANGRRVLQGDLAQMTRDAVIDNLYYQLAHRTVDSVEQSLSRAEKLLDKADDKVYGVVSVGLLLGRNQIQTSLDHAALGLICRSQANRYWERAKFALAQAACERVNDKSSDRSLYFAPMLEASWIKAVVASAPNNTVVAEAAEAALKETCSELNAQADPNAKRRYFWQPKPRLDFKQVQVLDGAFKDANSFSTYLSAEWAAGIALTNLQTIEIASGGGANSARGGDQVRRTILLASPAPPAQVQKVALAASSAAQTEYRAREVIAEAAHLRQEKETAPVTPADQAAQTAPKAFAANPEAMSGQVNLIAARLNLVNSIAVNSRQIQNVNMNPAAGNHASTKVFVGAGPVAARGDLCDNLPSWLVCRRRGGGVVEVESPPFNNGQFSDPSVRNMLRILAAASKSHNGEYLADITGFASASELRCQQVGQWGSSSKAPLFEGARVSKGSPVRFQYLNSNKVLGIDIPCTDAQANHVLSVARAAWAHSVLAGTETIKVQGIGGQGSSFADRKDNGHDRRIVVYLTPQ